MHHIDCCSSHQASVNASSPLKDGDIVLGQGRIRELCWHAPWRRDHCSTTRTSPGLTKWSWWIVMAHLMSSAQIERDFSAASLVLPSNRGSMDDRYFQAQLCVLWTFSTWCTQRICLLNACQPKKCANRYRLMVSAYQTCIPNESMMTLTTGDTTVRETYTQCILLSNKVCLVCWCHNVDKLNSEQNIPMCSRVWSRLSPIFPWQFACCLPSPTWQYFEENFQVKKCFSKNGMTMRKSKKIWEKRVGKGQVVQPNGTSWDRLEYLGQVGQGKGVPHIVWDRLGLGIFWYYSRFEPETSRFSGSIAAIWIIDVQYSQIENWIGCV